jgi:hypothetical protein
VSCRWQSVCGRMFIVCLPGVDRRSSQIAVHCGLSVALPWLLPDHLCLRSPPRRVVKSTIDSASHDPVDSRRPYKKLATARITMDVCRIEDDLLLAFLRWTSKLVTALRMT